MQRFHSDPVIQSGITRRPSATVTFHDENSPLKTARVEHGHSAIHGRARPPLGSLDNLLDPSPAVPFPRRTWKVQARPRPHEIGPPRRDLHLSSTTVASDRGQDAPAADESKGRGEIKPLWNLRKEVWDNLRKEVARQAAEADADADLGPASGSAGRSRGKGDAEVEEPPNYTGKAAALPIGAHPPRRALDPTRQEGVASPPRPVPSTSRLAPKRARQPLPPDLLSTDGLLPTRHRLKGSGAIEILSCEGGDVLIDLRERAGGAVLISGDGTTISVFDLARTMHPQAPLVLVNPLHVYSRHNLPRKYEKCYALALRFISSIRAKMPKFIFFARPPTSPIQTRHTIFSDSPPSYSLTFTSPLQPATLPTSHPHSSPSAPPHLRLTIHIDRTRSLIHLTRHHLQPRPPEPPPPLVFRLTEQGWDQPASHGLDALEQWCVEWAVGRRATIDQMDQALRGVLGEEARICIPTSLELPNPTRTHPPSPPLPPPPLPTNGHSLRPLHPPMRNRSTNDARSSNQDDVPAYEARTLATISVALASPKKSHARRSNLRRDDEPSWVGSGGLGKMSSGASEEDDERRCLPGAGWIERVRARDREARTAGYRVLFCDGEEVRVDVMTQEVYARGIWYSIDPDLPMHVKSRLSLVQEMIMLF